VALVACVVALVLAGLLRDGGADEATSSDKSSLPGPGRQARAVAPEHKAGVRPNIVMVMVDDMRDDDLRFMPRTRRLLGGNGVRFVNSFSPYPSCCPARASVLTGLYTHNHHVEGVNEPFGFMSFDDRSTLATWLDDVGYDTVYLGKYLNGYGSSPEPGQRDGTSLHYVPPGWDTWLASIDGGLPKGHPLAGGTYNYFDTTISRDGRGFRNFKDRYQTRVFGRLSRQIIRRRSASDRPYFLHVSYVAPHLGYPIEDDDPPWFIRARDGSLTPMYTTARPRWVQGRFDDRITTTPGDTWRDPDFSDKPRYLQARPALNRRERSVLLRLVRQRAEALWVLDQEVARTIRAVAATSEMPRTLILLTSDNGYFLGEQRVRAGKKYPHEPSLRVPLLIRGPGIPLGQRRTDPIASIDIAPTLASFAGVVPPTPVDGVSLARVASEGDQGWTRGFVTETGRTKLPGSPQRLLGLRTPRYLYVEVAHGGRELYDVRRDPQQYRNLAPLPAYDELESRLAEALHDLKDCRAEACSQPLPPELRMP
jgi:arylsulfatase A-like enzyme